MVLYDITFAQFEFLLRIFIETFSFWEWFVKVSAEKYGFWIQMLGVYSSIKKETTTWALVLVFVLL